MSHSYFFASFTKQPVSAAFCHLVVWSCLTSILRKGAGYKLVLNINGLLSLYPGWISHTVPLACVWLILYVWHAILCSITSICCFKATCVHLFFFHVVTLPSCKIWSRIIEQCELKSLIKQTLWSQTATFIWSVSPISYYIYLLHTKPWPLFGQIQLKIHQFKLAFLNFTSKVNQNPKCLAVHSSVWKVV